MYTVHNYDSGCISVIIIYIHACKHLFIPKHDSNIKVLINLKKVYNTITMLLFHKELGCHIACKPLEPATIAVDY